MIGRPIQGQPVGRVEFDHASTVPASLTPSDRDRNQVGWVAVQNNRSQDKLA